jgi:hypothetical protein
LGYEVVELSDPLNRDDRSYIVAFVSEPFKIEASCGEILKYYPAWNTARVKPAIVKKPRTHVQDKSAMLAHIARELRIDQKIVVYLDDYIRMKSLTLNRNKSPTAGVPPIYVPVAGRVRTEGRNAWTITSDALDAIEEWRLRANSPIILVGGEGGTGKTHIAREASERWNQTGSIQSFGIDSQTFIQKFETRLASNSQIEIYDIYLECLGGTSHVDKESFYDQWMNGICILTIDGIDEIANRARDKFAIAEFLEEVLQSDTEGFGKLIITAREFLVTDDLLGKVAVCQLQPFDSQRAKSFFEKTYERYKPLGYSEAKQKFIERSMRDANSLQKGQPDYVPYVLSLIAESYIESETGIPDFSSGNDAEEDCADITEFVVNRVCQREMLRIKDSRIRVDEQRRIFELLAAEGTPGGTEETYRRLIGQVVDGEISTNLERFLQSHLLLSKRDISGVDARMLWFRYDFHAEHFMASFVVRYINRNAFGSDAPDGLPRRAATKLIESGGYDDPLVTAIADRLRSLTYDQLLQGILSTMQATELTNRQTKRYLDAVLFNIALKKGVAGGDRPDTVMNLLSRDLFGARNGTVLEGLTICQIPRQPNRRMVLDFSGLTIENAFFEDWHDFFNCAADQNTTFVSTIVNRCGVDLKGATPLGSAKFDRSSCSLDDSAQARLLSISASRATKEEAMRESLRRFFADFKSGVGQFRSHVGKNFFYGRGFATMQAANLVSPEQFVSILVKLNLVEERDDRRGGHFALSGSCLSDVADFVDQARERKSIREAIKTLVAMAR